MNSFRAMVDQSPQWKEIITGIAKECDREKARQVILINEMITFNHHQ